MRKKSKPLKKKRASHHKKILELQDQVRELSDTLEAIRNGEIDGLIVNASEGEQIFTLQTAEHPYRVLVEEMSEGAATVIEKDVLSYSNSSFAQMVQTNLEDVIGRSVYDFTSSESTSALKSLIMKAWQLGSARGEVHFSSGKRSVPVLLSASLVDQNGTRSLCLIATDLTEQKRNEHLSREKEERLHELKLAESSRQIAETANRAKSNFLANMSHEIRTPLGAILGFAQLMNDPNQSFSARQDCLATILRNGDLLAKVINEVLDLSKIESDKLEIEKIEFDATQVIEDVTSLLNLQAQEKGIKLSVDYKSQIPNALISDPTRLRQILFNIVGNAIKFTSQGEVSVSVAAKEISAREVELRLEISDTGPGMTEEQQSRIFQAFAQADSSTTRKHGGTGLGLMLAQRLAQALRGDVTVSRSVPGEGTTFVVSLIAEALWNKTVSKTRSEETALGTAREISLRGTCVLVVDDSPDNRVLVSHFLKAAGADVECADDGNAGIAKAISGNFDVVLMDIQMPGLDGYDALTKLRSMKYTKPVVALTAHAMKGDRERCLSVGFDDHLVKPIDRIALIRTIADFKTF